MSVRVVEKALRKNGRVMVKVSVTLPKPDKKQRHMRTYYQTFERVLMRHAVKRLLPSAVRGSQACKPAEFVPYTLTAKHTVTLHTDTRLSLYTDIVEYADGLAVTERIADTWDLGTGLPMGLGAFFPSGGFALPGHAKRQAASAVASQALHDAPSVKHLRIDDFYLTPDRIVLFWQPGAAGSSGHSARELSLPRA